MPKNLYIFALYLIVFKSNCNFTQNITSLRHERTRAVESESEGILGGVGRNF
jgi:hypothetical protein